LFLFKTYAQHNAFPGQQVVKYNINISNSQVSVGDGATTLVVQSNPTSGNSSAGSYTFGGD